MGNIYMEATQINYRRDETLKTVDQKLQELSETSAIDTDIAPVFKSTDTYHAGDLVYYRNKLYVFTTDHTGAWAAADVTATNVSGAMNAALAGKADYADIVGAFSAETAYTAGDLVNYNGTIYRCTNDHTGDWDADDFSATTIGAEINAINSNLTSVQNRRYAYNISTADLQLENEYTADLPNGYNRLNTMITGINIYKYSTVYSEKYLAHDSDLDCFVCINANDKLSYRLKGSLTVGTNTYLRVMIERI